MINEEQLNEMIQNDRDIIESLKKSEEDIANGRVRNAREVFKELNALYGF